MVQACLLNRSPSTSWRESLLAVIRRSTVKNLKQRLIYTTDDNDDDDKTTTGGVPSSYNDDWGRQRRRFIPLVTKLGQATTKMTLMILDLMTLDTDTEHWCFTAVEWCSEMLIWSVYMGTHGWIGLPRIRSIATTRYINVRLFLDCLCLFLYTDYWFSTLIFFEDKLFCDFEMDYYSFDDADWLAQGTLMYSLLLCSCREPLLDEAMLKPTVMALPFSDSTGSWDDFNIPNLSSEFLDDRRWQRLLIFGFLLMMCMWEALIPPDKRSVDNGDSELQVMATLEVKFYYSDFYYEGWWQTLLLAGILILWWW